MNADTKSMDVTIMGREFRVACPEHEQPALLASVDYLERRMREIRDSGKVIGIERIAIMAALYIAHEHLTAPGYDDFDVGDFRRRIRSMQATIDRAMSEQDSLF
ncbi:MAG: cell division protein ZapA [Betaproteobacteria bacterium]|nr:cell division protein ZapA [Betaproteobacteria bacterium]MDA8384017.1 cell division protein ZapA [Betaproteobacteria bacterium]